MGTEDITLRVSSEAAEAFRNASAQERLDMEALVSRQLLGYIKAKQDGEEFIAFMADLGEKVRAGGDSAARKLGGILRSDS